MSAIVVRIRLFAMLRERAGTSSLELALPSPATVADALGALREREELGGLLARMPVRMAVNREYAALDTPLAPEDELALIPPVSGGAGTRERVHVLVSAETLDAHELSAAVADPAAGAIVVFQGVTREVPRLEYEAYTTMASEQIERLAREALSLHGLCAVAVAHRVGEVALGECSVLVAVSAPHRDEAFAGARMLIDEIKASAPIWKREHSKDGSRWVAGTEPAP